MIDKILYVNLNRRPDRNEWFLDNMEKAGGPMEIVKMFPAHDWQDYGSIADIIRAMQDDGFALNLARGLPPSHRFGSIGNIWSHCCCLRQIINSGDHVLVMQDDVRFDIPYDELLAMLQPVVQKVKGFHIIQLEWAEVVGEWAKDSDLQPNLCYPFENDYRWSHGIHGLGDKATIYSPTGALAMLGLLQNYISGPVSQELAAYHHFNNHKSAHTSIPVHHPESIIKWAESSLRKSDILEGNDAVA